jgi:hypothetical protein
MPTNDNADNIYIDNSLRHLATQHPIFWSPKDLSLMGVPDVLPTVPIPPTDISGFSYANEEFDSVIGFDDHIAELKEESQPYRQLKALVRAIAEWCGVNRASMVYTSNLHPLLKLGEYRYLLKPVCLISCVDVPSIVYLDAPLRGHFKKTYWGKPIDEFLKSCALGQSEDALEPFDFAMLIALAQEHRFCEVEPDTGGYYTVWHPVSLSLGCAHSLHIADEGLLSRFHFSKIHYCHSEGAGGDS